MKDGIKKYKLFVESYNYEREHGGIDGMTPAEKFMKCLKPRRLIRKGKKCHTCWYIVLSTMSAQVIYYLQLIKCHPIQ